MGIYKAIAKKWLDDVPTAVCGISWKFPGEEGTGIFAENKPKQMREQASHRYGNMNAGYTRQSENWGPITSSALCVAGILGAKAISKKSMSALTDSDIIRALMYGGVAPNAAAAALSAAAPGRTKAQQRRYEQSNKIWNLVVPGLATWNKTKSLGRIHHDQM